MPLFNGRLEAIAERVLTAARIRAGFLALLLISWAGLATGMARQSVLYAGGPLYTSAAAHRDMIRGSGFTTLVIWTIHVEADGDLVLNNHKIVDNGVYVGRAEWPEEVAAFKSGPTSVSRIELGLSGHESATFLNIRDLVFAHGTGTNGILYRNFQLLKRLIPAIDGINYDEESHLYDENVLYTMKQFSVMLADLGFNIELDVFCCSSVWSDLFNFVNGQRRGTIDRIDLQCYAGGGGNDPCSWNSQFGGLRVTPGLWAYPASESGGYWARNPTQVEGQMGSWQTSCNLAGGFMWYLDDMLQATNQYAVADYGKAINRALGIAPARKLAATVCQHTDYWGWTVELGVGPHGELELSAAGGQIGDISSLKVAPGYQVTLYSEANFTGSILVKTANDASLVDDGWNDRVKSLTVLRIKEPPVRLYRHADYWGWSAAFEVGEYTLNQILDAGGLDNDASAVEVAPGYKVTFFEFDNFQGRKLVKTASDASLVDDGWNDLASSIKVEVDLEHWKPVMLYQDAAYSGWSAGFAAGGYTLSQIIAAGGQNDDVTSLRIAPGYTVAFFKDNHFRGASLVKTADDVCLFDDGWNDQVSSMIVQGPGQGMGPAMLTAAGSVWKYHALTNDLGEAWRSNTFNDASWPSGAGRLGYGGDGEATVVPNNGQLTTYFRRHFFVENPLLLSNLNVRLTRDDAAVIYLNGSQIWRDTNFPSGAITNQTPALSRLDGTNETGYLFISLSPATRDLLLPGWNLLAAEVHNQSLSSSDCGFDLEVSGTVVLAPGPVLKVTKDGPALAFAWPDYAYSHALYATTNLARASWASVTNSVFHSNGAWSAQWPIPRSGQLFFRLEAR